MLIYPNSCLDTISNPAHPVFKFVEKEFEDWYQNTPAWATEPYRGWGEDEPAVFERRGAIEQGIEDALNEAIEEGKPVNLAHFDLVAAFQC